MIFQKSRSFSKWRDNRDLYVTASIEGLSIEKDSARTIFSNSFDPDVEQRVIPFMIDELVEVANKLKALDGSVSKNAQDIVDVKERVSAVEEAIKNLGEIEGGESLGEIVSEVKLNTAAIATLKGDENAEKNKQYKNWRPKSPKD